MVMLISSIGITVIIILSTYPNPTRYSRVLPISKIDLTPAQTTVTGVLPSSLRSALTSMPAKIIFLRRSPKDILTQPELNTVSRQKYNFSYHELF